MNLFRFLLLAFITVPLVEIFLFIKVGGAIGVWQTIFLVFATAVLGAWLWRWQGLVTLNRVRETMARNELPAIPLLEGALLILAGALLVTPGFFTDAVGFLLLFPPTRNKLANYMIIKGIFSTLQAGGVRQTPSAPHIIEGEFQRREDN